jgi:hypothetical protein
MIWKTNTKVRKEVSTELVKTYLRKGAGKSLA